ncbi:hypothetical protein [Sandaracinus amylolyticus]|uniref:hypothetical protein n=1 Tax=Sandaracinus amylolyticus TaxID=927083 RepID=UPI001F3458AC|nr:hypothetical protein [Sandaracinus amylolyticus]UJR85792.1 Hypothetical protein I5071_78720 [Sandaracinus amylolyticus]
MSEPVFDRENGTIVIGGSRLVFHCHHYNVFLQRSLEDALGDRAVSIQRRAASEAARTMLERLFAQAPSETFAARMTRAASLFATLGFGRADVSEVTPMGGLVTISPSHYAVGWIAKFGPSTRPVDHFATGFFRGALTAAAGLAPERVDAEQRACASMREGGATEILLKVR